MIWKALLTLLFLLGCWSVIALLLPDDLPTEQSIFSDNLIRAEEYLLGHTAEEPHAVIVGSSLVTRLPATQLGGYPLSNLGLAGQGLFDGLETVRQRGYYPELLLVETNLPLKPINTEYRRRALHPTRRWLKRWAPGLRERYRPVGVLKGGVFWVKRQLLGIGPPLPEEDMITSERALGRLVAEYAVVPAPDTLREVLSGLREELAAFREAGTRVILVEMPVHPALRQSPRALAIRRAFREVLPAGQFEYRYPPEGVVFPTTDGHHLYPAPARTFGEILNTSLLPDADR